MTAMTLPNTSEVRNICQPAAFITLIMLTYLMMPTETVAHGFHLQTCRRKACSMVLNYYVVLGCLQISPSKASI